MPRKIVGGFVLLLAIFAIPVRAEEWSKTFELNGKADLRYTCCQLGRLRALTGVEEESLTLVKGGTFARRHA